MAFLAPIGAFLTANAATIGAVSAAGTLAATALQKGPKPAGQLLSPKRDDARAQIQGDDEIRKRRGAAADILYGAEGAGAPAITGKLVLGA